MAARRARAAGDAGAHRPRFLQKRATVNFQNGEAAADGMQVMCAAHA